MKTRLTALALATVTALSFAPKPAAANDKGLALVGGFLGGLIVASAINDSRHEDGYYNRPTAVVVNERYDRGEERDPCGYWNDVCVQVWVPGCWVVERSYYGRDCRRYVDGHYERRNNRVWVAANRYDRRDTRDNRDHRDSRDRRDRDSGYGHRR